MPPRTISKLNFALWTSRNLYMTSLIQANYGCEDRIYEHLLHTATIIFSHLAGLCKCVQCFSLGSNITRGQLSLLQDSTWSGVSLDDTAGSEGDGFVWVAPIVGVVGVVGVATPAIMLWLVTVCSSIIVTRLE